MKSSSRILTVAFATLLGAASALAQTTTAPTSTTTPTRPDTSSTGGATTGTTNSGGVAPAMGRPTETPTGPTAGGTGSGTTTPTMVPGGSGTGGPATTTTPTTTPTTPPPTGPGNAMPHTPNEHASDTAKAVMTVIQQFDAKRDQAMADRKALIDKLQAAKTEAERQAIITQLRTETQAEKDQQTQLGKQIREELKKLRDARKSGG